MTFHTFAIVVGIGGGIIGLGGLGFSIWCWRSISRIDRENQNR